MKVSNVKKILLGLAAFSLFVTPARASEITNRDGNSLIDPEANVHNLYAQELDGTTARSTYDKFNLDENQIANMHFNVEGGTTFATDLINVVNHRIDINGTVNAIRNGAIDGNLFFLSPEGIAVGKSGVINAGSFNAQSDGGSIDINGTINARNNISLVGQNITLDGATLNAKTDIDFTTLVNAGDTVNTLENLQMTADPSGNGDIIIRAESTTTLDTSNDDDSNISLQAIAVNSDVSDLDSAYARKLINDGAYTTTASTGGATACIADSNITADGNITINSVEHIDANLVNGSQSNVGATVIAVNHNSKIAIDHSTISGKSVDIRAQQSGNINSTVNHAGAGVAEFGIGYNSVKRSGDTTVSLRGSTVTASNGNLNIRAEDNLAVTLNNSAPLTPAVGVNSSVAKYNNGSNTRVIVESLAGIADILNASGDIIINANLTPAVNVNGTTTVNNAIDNANVGITVKDGSHSFNGSNISVSSDYSPVVTASTVNLGGGNNVNVGGDNSFDATTVNFIATSNAANVANSVDNNTTVNVGSQSYSASPAITVDANSNIANDSVTASIGSGDIQQAIEKLTVSAQNSSNANANVSANVGGSWLVTDNVSVSAVNNALVGNTTAAIDNDAIIIAKSFDASARSNFNVDNTLDSNADLNINLKNAVNLDGAITTSGAQALNATSNGSLVNSSTGADANSNIAVDNQIRIAGNITSSDNITLKAVDLLTLDTTAVGGNTNISLDRNNLVDVKGTVDAAGIINVEAGGTNDTFFDDARQIAVNAVADNAYYSLVERNSITVDGNINAGADITLRADSGNVNFARSANSVNTNLDTVDNIIVNGNVTAGSSVKGITVDIAGIVVPSKYNIAGTDNSGALTVNSNVDVDYTIGDQQYAQELGDRLVTLNNLINQYSTGEVDAANNTAALAGFVNERDRLLDKLRRLNLIVSEGNNESVKVDGSFISYVELGNISTSGGNLNLITPEVKGNGILTAASAPPVTITNRSNAYLRITDITLGTQDGNVNLNGKPALAGDSGIAKSLTVNATASAGAGLLTILNDPDNSALTISSKDDPTVKEPYIPVPDLRLTGAINSPYGDIQITNRHGDIDIAAEYVKDTSGRLIAEKVATINGRNVFIDANGDLNQGYVETLINIGGDPPADWFAKETADAQATAAGQLDKTAEKSSYEMTVAEDVSFSSNDGRISGNNIYIAALDINVNGIIQAGFDSYITQINPSDIKNGKYVGKTGAVYNPDKGYYDYYIPVTYADGRLKTGDIETGGGTIFLSGQIASTGNGKILAANGIANISVENNTDIPIEIGKVVNNNREGKITVTDFGLDRWSEFTPGQTRYIDNYSTMLARHYNDSMLYDTIKTTSNNLDEEHMDYTPATGMRYNWTTGTSTLTRKEYSSVGDEIGAGSIVSSVFDFFGLDIGGRLTILDKKKLESIESTMDVDTTALKNANLDSGIFLAPGGKTDNNLDLRAESRLMTSSGPTITRNYYDETDYLLVTRYEWNYAWKYETGSTQAYTFNINAAHPIELGFIGHQHAPIDINSNADVFLAGNITFGDQPGLLSIQSDKNIRQLDGTLLGTNNALLRAGGDIRAINIESLGYVAYDGSYSDIVNIDARSNGGNIDINVQGGVFNGHGLPGNVFIAPLISQSDDGSARGNVTLTATGSINGLMASLGKNAFTVTPDIVANNIRLNSLDSSVGKYGTPLKLDTAGAVDVDANNDVAIASAFNNTLTIGQIVSHNGNVYINSWGDQAKIAQSASYQHDVDDVDSTALIHAWIDAGLIAPTEDYQGAYVGKLIAAVTDYANSISAEYQTYAQNRDAYNQLKTTVANEYQQYLAVKDSYNDEIEQTSVLFTRYQTDAGLIRNSLENEYADMKKLESKTRKSSSEKTRLKELRTKFAGFDSADEYFIEHGKELLNNDAYNDFIGYDDVFDYMASTYDGKLIAKYSNFDSPDAYLKTTSGYALEQKYGAYPTIDDFLNSDDTYHQLVSARDNVSFPSTLEEMLEQAARQRQAEALNINSNHLYVDNRKLR